MRLSLADNLIKRIALAFATVFVSFGNSDLPAQASTIRYNILPVEFSDGYALEGGFIETDGTIGTLAANNIIDYEVRVSGFYPFVFSPSNPEARVGVSEHVTSSIHGIRIPLDLSDSAAGTQLLGFSAKVDFIYYDVKWMNYYEIWEYEDPTAYIFDESTIYYTAIDPRYISGGLAISGRSTSPQASFVVATLPEPTTLVLCLTVLASCPGRGRPRFPSARQSYLPNILGSNRNG